MIIVKDDRLFEWDDEKNKINQIKHHISFQTAVKVFDDEHHIIIPDDEHSIYEERHIVIGKIKNIVFVVYTERNDAKRIISARLASPKERKVYYDNQNLYS